MTATVVTTSAAQSNQKKTPIARPLRFPPLPPPSRRLLGPLSFLFVPLSGGRPAVVRVQSDPRHGFRFFVAVPSFRPGLAAGGRNVGTFGLTTFSRRTSTATVAHDLDYG